MRLESEKREAQQSTADWWERGFSLPSAGNSFTGPRKVAEVFMLLGVVSQVAVSCQDLYQSELRPECHGFDTEERKEYIIDGGIPG